MHVLSLIVFDQCIRMNFSYWFLFVLLTLKHAALRWQTHIANNVKFAENNGGEYQTEQDPVIFLNILDVLTSPLTFRYCLIHYVLIFTGRKIYTNSNIIV